MGKYIAKRLLWMIPIIFGVAILVFTLMYFCPGNPEELILGSFATEADYAAKRLELGLDDPFLIRLARYLSDTFIRFDFGKSWMTNVSIKQELMARLPRTMVLSLITLLFAFGIGTPLGVLAAVHQDRWQDRMCMIIALIAVSMPNFWLALMLILLFSVKLGWLPALGIGNGGLDTFKYFVLPALSGFAGAMASSARQTRSSMLDVIRSDYIITARAKGVPERQVIYKHALKNALIPIITMLGSAFGTMLGGAMIIETVFSIPGMGTYIVGAVNNRDQPIVLTGTVFLAIIFSVFMLLTDLMYAFVDPRIKAQYQGKNAKKGRAKKNG